MNQTTRHNALSGLVLVVNPFQAKKENDATVQLKGKQEDTENAVDIRQKSMEGLSGTII